MLLITCPWCGPRAHPEFTYGGDATKLRPRDPEVVSDADWHTYVYLRANPAGPHAELWHHSHGCRLWIQVLRDTVTHEVIATALPGAPLPKPEPPG
jgi:heterotetrameric sarcosine oxidase delta subunit